MKSVTKAFAVIVVVGAALMLLGSPAYAFRGDGSRTFHRGHAFHGGWGVRPHYWGRGVHRSFHGFPYYSATIAAYPVYYYPPPYVVYRPSYVIHRTVVRKRPQPVRARPAPVYKQDRN